MFARWRLFPDDQSGISMLQERLVRGQALGWDRAELASRLPQSPAGDFNSELQMPHLCDENNNNGASLGVAERLLEDHVH